MGQLQYTTIIDSKCCGGKPTEFTIPIGATPHEIAELTGMPITRAIELWETRITDRPDLCPVIYLSSEISKILRKECQFGVGSEVTVIVPAGQFSSQVSQFEADLKAQEYFDCNAQDIANAQGICITADCTNCTEYRVTRTSECGEYRIDTECRKGVCVDISVEYFICTGLCNHETCLQPCTTCSSTCPNGDCPEGYSCIKGKCVKNCTGQPCSYDCPNGFCNEGTCIDGECVVPAPDCTVCNSTCPDGQCPEGQTCNKGRCELDCTSAACSAGCINGNCPQGQSCVKGVCENDVIEPDRCEGVICNDTVDTFECQTIVRPVNCVNGECKQTTASDNIVTNQPNGTPCINGTCLDGICQSTCNPPCTQDDYSVTNGGCVQSRQRKACIAGACIETGQTDRIVAVNGTDCTAISGLAGECIDSQCIEKCVDEGEIVTGEEKCCEGLFKRPSDNKCIKAIPIESKIFIVYDTTSFSSTLLSDIRPVIEKDFFDAFKADNPLWVGYEAYTINGRGGNSILESTDPSSYPNIIDSRIFFEDWLSWSVIPEIRNESNAIVICVIDESSEVSFTDRYHSKCIDGICGQLQPSNAFIRDYITFKDIYDNFFNAQNFKGIVYAVPAGTRSGDYADLHFNVYGSVEGIDIYSKGSDFIDTNAGNFTISNLLTNNPYAPAADGAGFFISQTGERMVPLKTLGWREKHDFPDGGGDVTVDYFKTDFVNDILELLGS